MVTSRMFRSRVHLEMNALTELHCEPSKYLPPFRQLPILAVGASGYIEFRLVFDSQTFPKGIHGVIVPG